MNLLVLALFFVISCNFAYQVYAYDHANVKLNGEKLSSFVSAYQLPKKPKFGERLQPYPSEIDVSLSSSIASHNFKLRVDPDIWAPGAVTYTFPDGKTESIVPPAVQYRAEFSDTTVSATIFQNGISMLIHNITSGESVEVRPKAHLGDALSPEQAASFEGSETLIFTPKMPPSSCGSEAHEFHKLARRSPSHSRHESHAESNHEKLHKRLGTAVDFDTHGTAPMFTDCYTEQATQQVAQIGFHVDYLTYGYLDPNFGTPYKTLAFIGSLVADSNVVYKNQLNIVLRAHPSATKILTYPNGTPGLTNYTWNWSNSSCFGTLNNGLSLFNNYANALPAQNDVAAYAQLSKCSDSNGYAGLGFVGTACGGSRTSVSIVYGTTGASTWLIFAHELGHNFNASHAFQLGQGATGGIMDYGDGRYPPGSGWYGFHPTYNKAEVCTKIQNIKTQKPSCLVPISQVASVCGNGIVEDNEDCDPGPGRTSPCCTSSCKFAAGAVCDYQTSGSSSSCCTNQCTFQPPSFSCGYQQFCTNGACVESVCAYYSNIDFCSLSACTYGCKFTTAGSTCRTPSYFSPLTGGNSPDGSYCDVGKVCSAGACIATTTTTTSTATSTMTTSISTASTTTTLTTSTTKPITSTTTTTTTTKPTTTSTITTTTTTSKSTTSTTTTKPTTTTTTTTKPTTTSTTTTKSTTTTTTSKSATSTTSTKPTTTTTTSKSTTSTTTIKPTTTTTTIKPTTTTTKSTTTTSKLTTTTTKSTTTSSKSTTTSSPTPLCTTPLVLNTFDKLDNLLGGATGTNATGTYWIGGGIGGWAPVNNGYLVSNLFVPSAPAASQCRSMSQYKSFAFLMVRGDSSVATTVTVGLQLGCATTKIYVTLGTVTVDGTTRSYQLPLAGVSLSEVKSVVFSWTGSVKPIFYVDNFAFGC
ncbi:hypothetical protein HK098_003970 [Nowakowskiella sp. JEL0407]|nr:hypothetical protein HK098_003970 [Nowakowskiella sp. JEL0407]